VLLLFYPWLCSRGIFYFKKKINKWICAWLGGDIFILIKKEKKKVTMESQSPRGLLHDPIMASCYIFCE